MDKFSSVHTKMVVHMARDVLHTWIVKLDMATFKTASLLKARRYLKMATFTSVFLKINDGDVKVYHMEHSIRETSSKERGTALAKLPKLKVSLSLAIGKTTTSTFKID